jgi:methionine synthase II (cobalamin-independent)
VKTIFSPCGLPLLIGSLPLADHGAAHRLVMRYTPEIPLWVQLPRHPGERMIPQFQAGMPGLVVGPEGERVATAEDRFAQELLAFYEEYMAVIDGHRGLADTRFGLEEEAAPGFFTLLRRLPSLEPPPRAVKGQITGPVTFALALKNAEGRAIFYDPSAREAAGKLLALKARWQVEQLAAAGCPVFLFVDEPGLTGLGSSALIGVSDQEVRAALEEVFGAIRGAGGLAGIHVCGNTDWGLILGTTVEVVSFDAYAFFDHLMLYGAPLRDFLSDGRILALGIVPTLDPQALECASRDAIIALLEERIGRLQALGFSRERIVRQLLVTPSCGTGSLNLAQAEKVLELTRAASAHLRQGDLP